MRVNDFFWDTIIHLSICVTSRRNASGLPLQRTQLVGKGQSPKEEMKTLLFSHPMKFSCWSAGLSHSERAVARPKFLLPLASLQFEVQIHYSRYVQPVVQEVFEYDPTQIPKWDFLVTFLKAHQLWLALAYFMCVPRLLPLWSRKVKRLDAAALQMPESEWVHRITET